MRKAFAYFGLAKYVERSIKPIWTIEAICFVNQIVARAKAQCGTARIYPGINAGVSQEALYENVGLFVFYIQLLRRHALGDARQLLPVRVRLIPRQTTVVP